MKIPYELYELKIKLIFRHITETNHPNFIDMIYFEIPIKVLIYYHQILIFQYLLTKNLPMFYYILGNIA